MKLGSPHFLACGLILSGGVLTDSTSASAQAPVGNPGAAGAAASGDSFLEGTAAWDMALVQEYFKKEHQIDVPTEPTAFPEQNMLNQLNPEFRKRLNALMAVYQAFGGRDLGITPRTGGLRTEEMQNKIFRTGRRLRMNPVTGAPVGNGSQRAHYEVMPNQRTVPGAVFNANRQNAPFLQGRRLRWNPDTGRPVGDGSRAQHFEALPRAGNGVLERTVSDAWGLDGKSWHQYGMAVDVAWHPNGRYNNSELGAGVVNPASPIFGGVWALRAVSVAPDLGLCSGFWWRNPVDPPHIEWHPRLEHSPNPTITRNNPRGLPRVPAAARAGTALTDEQINAGYKWKIPDKIFIWFKRANGDQSLDVLELVKTDHWIRLKKMRHIYREASGAWHGSWSAFVPPVKLFPTYIPTSRLSRNEGDWPEDQRWRDQTEVFSESYYETIDSAGKVNKDHREERGKMDYAPYLSMRDWQMEADTSHWQRSNDRQRYAHLRHVSIYDIEVETRGLQLRESMIKRTGRRVDAEGFTSDWESNENGFMDWMASGFQIGWNRDTGQVGLHLGDQAWDERPYELVERSQDGLSVVSAQLPRGAFDHERLPTWTPKNLRPKFEPQLDFGNP